VDIKKLCGYPYNKYSKDMDTGTRRIFIQSVGYARVTTRTLPASLTSLDGDEFCYLISIPIEKMYLRPRTQTQ